MDKDFVWKFEYVGHGRLKNVAMAYRCSIVLDPTESDESLKRLVESLNSRQTRMNAEAEVESKMRTIHNEYDRARFDPVDFIATLVKVENKPYYQQLVQLRVSTASAVRISELGLLLERAAVVLDPMSEDQFAKENEAAKRAATEPKEAVRPFEPAEDADEDGDGEE